jgi:hypothetical protein
MWKASGCATVMDSVAEMAGVPGDVGGLTADASLQHRLGQGTVPVPGISYFLKRLPRAEKS